VSRNAFGALVFGASVGAAYLVCYRLELARKRWRRA
jgi:hypothetical protein